MSTPYSPESDLSLAEGLASNQPDQRCKYTLATIRYLANSALTEILTKEMGLDNNGSSAVLKRLAIINSSGDNNIDYTGNRIAFYSSDDLGKDPPKPPVIIKPSSMMNPAVRIDSPFKDVSIVTVNPPAEERILTHSFAYNKILTREEINAAIQLRLQTLYWARFVLLGKSFQNGDSLPDENIPLFGKAAYFDSKSPVKFNRGFKGFLSQLGFGEVIDVNRHGTRIHVDKSQKGIVSSTDTWVISQLSGLAHPFIGRSVSYIKD